MNSRKLLGDVSDTKVGSYPVLNENKPARGQEMRRSLVVQDAKREVGNPGLIAHTKTHSLIERLPALPDRDSNRQLSLSNVLQRAS